MGLIKVLEGNGQFNKLRPLIHHSGASDQQSTPGGTNTIRGGGRPHGPPRGRVPRHPHGTGGERLEGRRRWGYACHGLMLISAHLVASSSSSTGGSLFVGPCGAALLPGGSRRRSVLHSPHRPNFLLPSASNIVGFFWVSEELRKRKIDAQNGSEKQPLGPESGGRKPSS